MTKIHLKTCSKTWQIVYALNWKKEVCISSIQWTEKNGFYVDKNTPVCIHNKLFFQTTAFMSSYQFINSLVYSYRFDKGMTRIILNYLSMSTSQKWSHYFVSRNSSKIYFANKSSWSAGKWVAASACDGISHYFVRNLCSYHKWEVQNQRLLRVSKMLIKSH